MSSVFYRIQLRIVLFAAVVMVVIGQGQLYSQESITFSQYLHNQTEFNPAASGIKMETTASLITRQQWVGVAGSPQLSALSINSRLPEKHYLMGSFYGKKRRNLRADPSPVGVSAYLYNYKSGPISRTGINTSYAYHIEMGDNQLSFGLGIIFMQYKIDDSDFIFSDDETDPIMSQSILFLDANFGVYYTGENYFAGYSTTQLFNSVAQFGVEGEGRYKVSRAHHFIAGYSYDINRDFAIKPNGLLQIPEDASARVTIGFDGVYLKKYSAGLSYKSGSAMSFQAGIVVDRYRVGYAFDYNFSDIMPGTYGSHEIYLAVRLSRK